MRYGSVDYSHYNVAHGSGPAVSVSVSVVGVNVNVGL
jgi:hypothetical protein